MSFTLTPSNPAVQLDRLSELLKSMSDLSASTSDLSVSIGSMASMLKQASAHGNAAIYAGRTDVVRLLLSDDRVDPSVDGSKNGHTDSIKLNCTQDFDEPP